MQRLARALGQRLVGAVAEPREAHGVAALVERRHQKRDVTVGEGARRFGKLLGRHGGKLHSMRALFVCALAAGCTQSVSFPANSNWPAPTVPAYVHQERFAITDNLSDELSYVDPVHDMLLGDTPVGDVPVELEGPHHLAASPDGKYIYYNLSNYVPGTGSGPHGSHGTGTVPGSLVKLDAATNEKIAEVLVDRSPGDVILTRDGKTAFVSHYDQ